MKSYELIVERHQPPCGGKQTKLYDFRNVETERCKGCNLCVVACPAGVLELHPREVNNKGYHYVYMKQPEACVGCASCGLVCPDGCLTIYRAKK